jgi:hypothetical protein
MVRNLNIEIEVDKNLDFEGECVDEEGTRNPRWFTISLKDQELEDMIRTLAHEMVHVKQHAKNELKSGYVVPARGGLKITSKWKGSIWKPKRQEDPYFDSPWELEAFGKEIGLFQRYISHITLKNDKTNPLYVESFEKD